MIVVLTDREGRKGLTETLDLSAAGDVSNVITIPTEADVTTVQLDVTAGAATVQYSLSSRADVEDDKARWHDWSHGSISSGNGRGIALDSPITFIRVLADGASTTGTLEVLSE